MREAAAVSGISVRDKLRPHFSIFRSDEEGRPVEGTILTSNELREVLAFNKRPDWNYVFEYHYRFYSYSEFKRLVESGEIV
ncbi:MAG: hypothetical protein WDN29_09130 [Methylovirgula sp.]